MQYLLKQSQTARPLLFLLTLSSDHISPATGLGATPTVTLSKNGAAFGSPAGAITEIANGWYSVTGNATDTGTLGPLLLHATVATADPTDVLYEVVAFDPTDAAALGLSNVNATISSRATPAQILATPANLIATNASNQVTAASVQGNVTGSVAILTTNNDKTGYSLSVAPPTSADIATAVAAAILANGFKLATDSSGRVTVANTTGYTLDSGTIATIATAILSTPAHLLNTDAAGNVTAGTVTDKTGYALTIAPPTADEINTALVAAHGANSWQQGNMIAPATPGDVTTAETAILNAVGALPTASETVAAAWGDTATYPPGSKGAELHTIEVADWLAQAVPGSYTAPQAGYYLSRLAGTPIVIVSALGSTGEITILQDAAYLGPYSTAIPVLLVDSLPNLTGAVIEFATTYAILNLTSADDPPDYLELSSPTGAGRVVTLYMSSALTVPLVGGAYAWALWARFPGDHNNRILLGRGSLTITTVPLPSP